MFETFNRNLIKTIKAENPKHRGPRLCAMRIQQNGQSNILLDNIESMEAVTPIIYKRRERLLDEELDDTKDIITSNTTNISSAEIAAAHRAEDVGIGYTTNAENEKLADVIIIQADPLEKNTSTQAQPNETELQCGVTENELDPNSCVVTSNSPYERLGGGGEGREMFTADDDATGATATLIDLTEAPITASDLTAAPADQSHTAPEETARVQEKRNSLTSKSNVTPTISALDMALAQTSLEATGATQMRIEPVRTVSSVQQMHKPKHTSIYHSLQNESSSKTSHNSKSCTQSSSISDAIDIQESIILRRQQLNRVAEWVQSNTQQLEQQQQQQQQQQQRIQQQQQALNSLNNCDSSGGTDRQSSFSTLDPLDSVSMEKLSMDSGYKTTPQPHTNGFHQPLDDANKSTEDSLSPKTDTNSSLNNNNYKNSALLNHYSADCSNQQVTMHVYPTNTYFRRTTRSGLPVAYTTPDPNASNTETFLNNYNNNNNNSACSTTPTLPDQPTCDILNYKYYPSDTDKTRAISAELHTTTKHVDIAQMEYNVKQFLLKQNEWSMRTGTTRGCGRAGINTSASNLSSANSQVTLSSQRTQTTAKTLRHLKLFSGVGVGPGLGARVQPPLLKDASAVTAAAAGSLSNREERELKVKAAASANGVEGAKVTAAVAANALPHRTETNL